MNIIFYRHSLLSRGGDKMVLAHANHLVEQGHSVTIMASLVDTIFPINEKVEIATIHKQGKIGTLWSCLIQRLDTDVVIADIIPLACLLFIRNRKRVAYFAQDYNETFYCSLWQRLFIRCLYFIGLSLFRIPVIAVSDYLSGLLQHRFLADVSIATNGVDTSVFYPEPDPRLVDSKTGKRAILVFYREEERKGFDVTKDVLINFAALLPSSFVIWSVGASSCGHFSEVECRDFGYVKEADLRRIMSSADVFLFPSRHEGFGLMAIEALACGCPLVTTDAVKVVTHDVDALVSQVDDVASLMTDLRRLQDDPQLANRLVAAGHLFVRNNTLDAARLRFESILTLKF